MTVHHGTKIVQTVGESQCLWISHAFTHLLHTTMNISQMRIDMFHGFTVEHRLQAKHTMHARVIRAQVHDEVVFIKHAMLGCNQVSLLIEVPFRSEITLWFIGCREHVGFRTRIKILAERIALKVITHEQTAHVRMTKELDAQEIKHFTLKQVGSIPQINRGWNDIFLAYLLCNRSDRAALMAFCVLKNIDTAQAFLTKVFTNNGNKIVEMLFVLQLRHLCGKVIELKFYVI